MEAIIVDVAQVLCPFDFLEGQMKGHGRSYPMAFLLCAEHVRQPRGESSLDNRMEVKS